MQQLTQKSLFLVALVVFLTLLCCSGCAPTLAVKDATLYGNDYISEDTVWSGNILIDGTVKVAKGATLTIAPGTDIAFVRRDADEDGLGDAVLAVEGRLMALGTRQQPIRFHSAAENPQPGDWLEIRVDFSQEVHLRYCDIRDSAYTLHAHFTRGVVEDCTIHHNIDGCRLGQATFTFRNNLIEHNQGKGINFRNSTVAVHHNILRFNGSGMFLFENDRDLDIHHNNFYGNLDSLHLGDFYTGDVAVHHNWWGSADPDAAQATIYDRSKDPEIGQVTIQPAEQWVAATGPRDALFINPTWEFVTEGYVDADLVAGDDRLYVASWDGNLRALNKQGEVLWTKNLGDTLDASPVLAGGQVFVQSWSREVYALDAASGDVRWRFDYSPSRADDHRQAGLLVIDDLVLVPAWNGTLFALDAMTGERRWSFSGGQPLRAQPVYDGKNIYLGSGDGTLSALGVDGSLRWQKSLEAPLLRAPAILPQGVAVVSREGQVVAYDQNGQKLWQRELEEICYYGAPLYYEGALFVATAGNGLWKLDAATGDVVWRVELAGPSYATPLIDNGRIFIGDNSGALRVFGTDSGQLVTQYKLDREIQGRPLIWSELLLVGSRDHKVHAFALIERSTP
ncbi:MAG: PQQ-binding-like beta-propeller repeat protein [Desulfuromonadales bacterium]|nr:PQQ-binding-like beta-propeller repeat protein [Desulfuromonadales bacterium]